MLDILYQDEYLIAINKPHDLLVHRSPIARDTDQYALQLLRDQIGNRVYPAHRLDRKTGGILLFSLSKDIDVQIQKLFMERSVTKKYLALVRGFTLENGEIDYPLKKENGTSQEAITLYKTLEHAELPTDFGIHPTSRFSLVEATPITGRMHQLRKHFAHIIHPIIGDRPHGCNKQNKYWKGTRSMNTMLLHASHLTFTHPVTQSIVSIQAPIQCEFRRVLKMLRSHNIKSEL